MSKLIEEIAQETPEQLSAQQIFENEELKLKIRIIRDSNDFLYFNAEDTAIGFGWIQTQTKKSKVYTSIRWETLNDYCEEFGFPSLLGKGDYIPEPIFYRLAMKANNESANKFQNWLATDVLPKIRRTGGYIPVKEEDTDLEIMAKAHQIMERTIEEKNKKIEEQQILLEEKDAKIEEQQERIEDLEETEKDWKTLMDTTGTFSINQLSQFINIGEYHLFEYLRKLKVLWKNENNDNVPYRQHLSSGKFAVVPAVAPNGVVHSQTRVYPEGIPYITKLLRKNGYLA